uniref:Putative secreted protein n=1 Tax=Anopheles nuneztovari TaxID=30067 RepID=A0A2M3YWK0_9DIPT
MIVSWRTPVISAIILLTLAVIGGEATESYVRDGTGCQAIGGCVTQQGCVPRYSQYSTVLYCQRCVIDRCRSVEAIMPRRICYHLTSIASGQRLAAVENYDRRTSQRYASVLHTSARGDEEGHDKWHLIASGRGHDYYIRNFRTGEYLRVQENNFAYLAQGQPVDDSFLFKPHLVDGSWSCVLLQSVCYGGYLYGERYSASTNFVLMTRDLQRCYRESLWRVTSVYC